MAVQVETEPSLLVKDSVFIESRIAKITADAKSAAIRAGMNLGSLLIKGYMGVSLLRSLYTNPSSDAMDTSTTLIVSGALIFWAAVDVGEGIHKYNLSRDLGHEANSLRASLDRYYIESCSN